MSIAKYLHLLKSQTLWFSRLDKLGDKFEGSLTKPSAEIRWDSYKSLFPLKEAQGVQGINSSSILNSRLNTFVNCWHSNSQESMAMWKLYGSDYGIAVTTTLKRLESSLTTDREIVPALVKYIDYYKDTYDHEIDIERVIHKRKSFEHEREFRLIAFDPIVDEDGSPMVGPRGMQGSKEKLIEGVEVAVDLAVLIQEVRVDPDMPLWLFETIKTITADLGLDVNVRNSNLGSEPIF